MVHTPAQLDTALRWIKRHKHVAFDTEFTSCKQTKRLELLQIGLLGRWSNRKKWYWCRVIIVHLRSNPDLLVKGGRLEKEFLGNDKIVKICHAADGDAQQFLREGIQFKGIRDTFDIIEDILFAEPTIPPGTKIHPKLDHLQLLYGFPANEFSTRMDGIVKKAPWRWLWKKGCFPRWAMQYSAIDVYYLPLIWEYLTGEQVHIFGSPPFTN